MDTYFFNSRYVINEIALHLDQLALRKFHSRYKVENCINITYSPPARLRRCTQNARRSCDAASESNNKFAPLAALIMIA